jgi:hypothetical protein
MPFLQQRRGDLLRELGVAEHHGHDRVLARHDREAGAGHRLAEELRVLLHQLVAQRGRRS